MSHPIRSVQATHQVSGIDAQHLGQVEDAVQRHAPLTPLYLAGFQITDRALVAERMAQLLATALTTGRQHVDLGKWSGVAVSAVIADPTRAARPRLCCMRGRRLKQPFEHQAELAGAEARKNGHR